MTTPTSGPLYVDPFSAERAVSTNYGGIVLDSVQSALTREECEANVAEAVRRWNAHQDLLEVCEVILDAANDRVKDSLGHELPPRIRAMLEAAIAKATP